MKHAPLARSMFLAAVLACMPSMAAASDFSGIMYFFMGVATIIALILGVIAYFLARGAKSIFYRSLVWGVFAALVVTPLSTHGSNGDAFGPPILSLLVAGFGADPVYAIGALKVLALSIPVCVGIVALLIWAREKLGDDPGGKSGN